MPMVIWKWIQCLADALEDTKAVDLKSVMREIDDVKKAEANRLLFKAEAEARPD